jgi:tetratricopeptide (TPR) repeat protein
MSYCKAIVLLCFTAWAGCRPSPSADEHREISRELEQAGMVDSALYHLTLALAKEPAHAGIRIDRGVIRSEQGDQQGAIADLSLVIEADSMNTLAWYHRSLAKSRMNDHLGAYADLQGALRAKVPGWGNGIKGSFAVLETVDNEWAGVERSRFDVHFDDIGFLLALNYLDLDSGQLAYQWLTRCIDNDVETATCLFERGRLLLLNGQQADGCRDLERAALMRHTEALRAWNKNCTGKQ